MNTLMIKIKNGEGTRKAPLQRIEEFLEKEQGGSNAEWIRQMRAAYFADVDALQKSGRVKIPK